MSASAPTAIAACRTRQRLGAASNRAVVEEPAGRRPSPPRRRCGRDRAAAGCTRASAVPRRDRRGCDCRCRCRSAAGTRERDAIEYAIAEIGLGLRAQAGDRARAGERRGFGRRHVGGMDEAPATIDRLVRQQPLDRTLAAPGEAVGDFLGLFGDMDVDRPLRVSRRRGRRGLPASPPAANAARCRSAHAAGRGGGRRRTRAAAENSVGIGVEAALLRLRVGLPPKPPWA